ncbi:hypothetical protein N658DRAFT_526703 [Parathielavia hyrcaniae]|uniref:Uncharacterized protein n=1 Tax=Parathielavia hyrcaniae TaxID=113614 RepID=A0AAN6PTV5_9PEZI|nr:hypothetical protein N658DRAFT_526703 [Parathielavia hyrcaniae]
MRNYKTVAVLPLLAFVSAQEYQFFSWNTPRANQVDDGLHRRQSPPPGYHPEFGTCGSGTTCENACGPNWTSCQASTDLSLFCYNKVELNQTCCENGSGRACDSGYYCAWQEFGGKVWCCENGQSLEECGIPQSTASSATSSATSSTSSATSSTSSDTSSSETSSTTSDSSISGSTSITGTSTTSGTSSDPESTSQCPLSTVTFSTTITFVSATNIPAVTVTVTADCGGCSSSTSESSSLSWTSGSTSVPETITDPPSTSSKPPIRPTFNTTTTRPTSSIVTAGAAGFAVFPLNLALLLLSLLWI